MKNSKLQLIVSFKVIAFCFSIIGLNAQSNVVSSKSKKHSYSVYVSPLNLINPNKPATQITFGSILKNDNEFQFSYSHFLQNWDPIGLNDNYFSLSPFPKSGYRVGVEYQAFRKSSKRTYLALEAYYRLFTYSFDLGSTLEIIEIQESRIGLNFKLGHKFNLKNGFTFDLYTGLGISYNEDSYKDYGDLDFIHDTRYPRLHIPLNLKMGYNF